MIAAFFILFVVLLFIGVPVALAVGVPSLFYILGTGIQPMIVIQRLFSGVNVLALMAIPFFILAGNLMNTGGIARRLVAVANIFVGRFTGGLAIVTVMACMFFAAISGSGVATAAAMGMIMVPEMIKRGYGKEFASTVVASASPIGVIIPPSISFILYGVMTSSSISDLYLAGIPSGIYVGIALIIVCIMKSKKLGYKGDERKYTKKEIWSIIKDALWALGTPVILIGGVFGGWFTPTESAVIAVVYSIIVGLFIYKDMKIKDLPKVFLESAKTTANTMFIIACATIFAYVLSYERIPQMIVSGFSSLTSNPYLILLIINVILLLAGTFMETTAIMIILVPLLWPVAQQVGVNVVHFGLIVTVNTAIGLLTPPFGSCLFATSAVCKVPIEDICRHVVPFMVASILALLFITYVPQSILFLIG
ncbi:MAG: TRAP transporter large permease [Clostridia bacterium]|nr:TRAP transporter large permease [Clostridia bacterium]